MSTSVALVTNVTQYAGPAAAIALAADGFLTVAHDDSFVDSAVREVYAAANPGVIPLAAQDEADIVEEARTYGTVDVLVSNDYVPVSMLGDPFETAPLASYEAIMRALVYRPFLLMQALLPTMKENRHGRVIFITSAVAVRPIPSVIMYGTARAASTSMATAAAKAFGEFDILVNSIGPNWFENPTYFPPGRWEADAALRETVAKEVPLQRLGQQHEMGALIAFLASGKAAPVTGQFFGFTGGWLP